MAKKKISRRRFIQRVATAGAGLAAGLRTIRTGEEKVPKATIEAEKPPEPRFKKGMTLEQAIAGYGRVVHTDKVKGATRRGYVILLGHPVEEARKKHHLDINTDPDRMANIQTDIHFMLEGLKHVAPSGHEGPATVIAEHPRRCPDGTQLFLPSERFGKTAQEAIKQATISEDRPAIVEHFRLNPKLMAYGTRERGFHDDYYTTSFNDSEIMGEMLSREDAAYSLIKKRLDKGEKPSQKDLDEVHRNLEDDD